MNVGGWVIIFWSMGNHQWFYHWRKWYSLWAILVTVTIASERHEASSIPLWWNPEGLDLVQKSLTLVISGVHSPVMLRAQTTFHGSPPLFQLLHFFLSPFSVMFLGLGGGDREVVFKAEHSSATSWHSDKFLLAITHARHPWPLWSPTRSMEPFR